MMHYSFFKVDDNLLISKIPPSQATQNIIDYFQSINAHLELHKAINFPTIQKKKQKEEI